MKWFVTVDGQEHEVVVNGESVSFDGTDTVARVSEVEGTPVRLVTIADAVHRVIARPGARRGEYTVRLNGYRYAVDALDERARTIRRLSAASATAAGPARLVAPMPGLIVRVNVRRGDEVRAGQGLVVMEAMKMENELRAPADGRVKDVRVAPGTAVEKGAVLIDMEQRS
jgi:pyruvate carboxylase subunit B